MCCLSLQNYLNLMHLQKEAYHILNDVCGCSEAQCLVVVLVVIKEEQRCREEAVQVGGDMWVPHLSHTPDQRLLVGGVTLPGLTGQERF